MRRTFDNLTSRLAEWARAQGTRLHRDERGTISVISVFAIFLLTIVLGMVFNIGRQLDDKLRMQNAADAACYTGTLTLTRGMNAIAFTNHLECEVFALTAYMREGQQRYSESFMPEVFATWNEVGQVFASVGGMSGYQKFTDLGQAIIEKIPYEQGVVTAFGEMTARQSEMTLSVFEYILRTDEGQPPTSNAEVPPEVPLGGLIPRFQRALVLATPQIAQLAAQEVAERHGRVAQLQHDQINLTAVMYRTDLTRFDRANEYDRDERTLPVVDPSPTGVDGTSIFEGYYLYALQERDRLSRRYLELWIQHWMDRYFSQAVTQNRPGRHVASLSQLINFWRIFTCGQLEKLLTQEFPTTNLPFMIRVRDGSNRDEDALAPEDETLHDEYSFLAVVAWPQLNESFPGVFGNPLNADPTAPDDNTYALTFAQGSMFIPQARYRCCPWAETRIVYGPPGTPPRIVWINHTDNWNPRWTSLNQNWRARLEPVTSDSIADLLRIHPEGDVFDLLPPNYNVPSEDIHNVSMH